MAAIPTVIGGHTVRDPPQLDAGVSLNMYPERSKRETEFQSRTSRFQLSVHGYRAFDPNRSLPPVTGIAGTREAVERLVVANGRTLRVFDDPSNAGSLSRISVSGQPVANEAQGRPPLMENHLRPVFGCAGVDTTNRPVYYVRADGTVWWNSDNVADQPQDRMGRNAAAPIRTNQDFGQTAGETRVQNLDGITPLGMAVTVNAGSTDVDHMFLTCMEDRRIRAWRKDTREPAGIRMFTRDPAHDLDLSEDTAMNAPESIWFLDDVLLILDATTGRIAEYGFTVNPGNTPNHQPWERRTPIGVSNPFSFQRIAGDADTEEPVPFGGVFGDAADVRAIHRGTNQQIIADRRTGERKTELPGPSTFDGEGTQKYVCGALSGQSTRIWFVNGAQYNDGLGRLWVLDQGQGQYVKLTTPDLPDAEQEDPGPTPLEPMGDEGRHMGWVVDRRLHVLDLEQNRLITNVEGNVDSVAYSTGRLIAADASIGELKVSPVNQIRAADTERYGELVAAASMRIPGVSVLGTGATSYDRPNEIRSLVTGIREIITVTSARKALAFVRGQPYQPAHILNPTTDVCRGVCTGTDFTIFFFANSDSARRIDMRLYPRPPRTADEFALPHSANEIWQRAGTTAPADRYTGNRRNDADTAVSGPTGYTRKTLDLPLGNGAANMRAFAAAKSRVFINYGAETGDTNVRRIYTFDITLRDAGTPIAMLEHLGDSSVDDFETLFDGLRVRPAAGSEPPPDWLRGITFVADAASPNEGFLLMAIRQVGTTNAAGVAVAGRTVIRAFELINTTNAQGNPILTWQRAQARDLTTEATTDNRMLTHDSQFVFDSSAVFVNDQTPSGDPIRSIAVAAFRHALVERLSKYSWDPEQRSITGANSVAAIRRQLYAWTATGMEIRDLTDETQGFPYVLEEARTIGLIAPNSLAIVADVLYWLGVTEGGGLRVWRIGHSGDLVPEYVEGKAVEEMLDRIASSPHSPALEQAIGWSDDTGGHPTYVLHMRRAGISFAYDADADRWHVRSSLGARNDPRLSWPWMPPGQGAQRVAHSTTWRQRLICGGYDRDRHGVVSFYSPDQWTDIDGDPIYKRRQFAAGEFERRRVRFIRLRVDATYDLQGEGVTLGALRPRITMEMSNDGGATWGTIGQRQIGPPGSAPPRPFYRIGYSRQRVYRVDCTDPVPFALMGAYQEAAP